MLWARYLDIIAMQNNGKYKPELNKSFHMWHKCTWYFLAAP